MQYDITLLALILYEKSICYSNLMLLMLLALILKAVSVQTRKSNQTALPALQ